MPSKKTKKIEQTTTLVTVDEKQFYLEQIHALETRLSKYVCVYLVRLSFAEIFVSRFGQFSTQVVVDAGVFNCTRNPKRFAVQKSRERVASDFARTSFRQTLNRDEFLERRDGTDFVPNGFDDRFLQFCSTEIEEEDLLPG